MLEYLDDAVVILALVYSIVLHEIAHGFAACMFGDDTAKRAGRLSLNPIVHIDPFMTIALPVLAYVISGGTFIFGGAKPVPVNPHYFRNRVAGDIVVSIAGVAVNFAIALLALLLMNLVPERSMAAEILYSVAMLNFVLMIFNLLPIPPLDGGHVVKYALPRENHDAWEMIGRSGIGFIIIIVLLQVEAFNRFFFGIIYAMADFFGKILIFTR